MFRNKSVLSIDIGTYGTKVVEGKQRNDSIIISKAFVFKTPQDSFKDGKILNLQKIKEELHHQLKNQGIGTSSGICAMESTALITRELNLPIAKGEELEKMVEFEIEQYLPIMLKDYIVQHKILEEYTVDDIKKLRILVGILPKAFAEDYLHLLKELSLKPMALDTHSNAISKLFSKETSINGENYSLNKTIAVIDLGYEYSNINIISKGIPQFSRMIALGGRDIDVNISNTFGLSLEEAEKKKIELGNMSQEDGNHGNAAIFNDIVKSTVDTWIAEIQRVFQYYTSRTTGNRIDEIYLYGGSSKLRSLFEYIDRMIGIPTFNIESLGNIKMENSCSDLKLIDYLNLCGAIMRR